MQVGPLQPDGMVRLSAEFRKHFPAYAEGDWFWADHELVIEEFPTTPQPKDISWSDETIRVGLTFAAWTTAQRMGILEDLTRIFGREEILQDLITLTTICGSACAGTCVRTKGRRMESSSGALMQALLKRLFSLWAAGPFAPMPLTIPLRPTASIVSATLLKRASTTSRTRWVAQGWRPRKAPTEASSSSTRWLSPCA